jgi:hypothetical protein
MKGRPSYRELDRKLKQGNEAASANRIMLLEPDIILADLLDLDYLVEDLAKDLPALLREIRPGDYRGQSPPKKSYEKAILGSELFAFRWVSKIFGCPMYLKFAVKGENLWIVSLHRDKSKRGE